MSPFTRANLAMLRSLVDQERQRAASKLNGAKDDERAFYLTTMHQLREIDSKLAVRGAADRLEHAIAAEEAELESQSGDA